MRFRIGTQPLVGIWETTAPVIWVMPTTPMGRADSAGISPRMIMTGAARVRPTTVTDAFARPSSSASQTG